MIFITREIYMQLSDAELKQFYNAGFLNWVATEINDYHCSNEICKYINILILM